MAGNPEPVQGGVEVGSGQVEMGVGDAQPSVGRHDIRSPVALRAAHLYATLDGLGVPRHLSDHIVGIVAGLRPAVVTA